MTSYAGFGQDGGTGKMATAYQFNDRAASRPASSHHHTAIQYRATDHGDGDIILNQRMARFLGSVDILPEHVGATAYR